MSPADDNMPDFDKMSPEEMMAWMESLAKRQGATEGFTTAADMQIAEVDPDTVIIDEPGYVPSEGKSRGKAPEPAAPRRQPAAAAPTPAPPPPAPAVQQPAASLQPPMPAAPAPLPVLEPLEEEAVETELAQPVEEQGAMAWLESLAADQGAGFPELDLSSLGAEIEPMVAIPEEKGDPMAWLENLAEDRGEPAASPTPSAEPVAAGVADPFASGVDPMAWLESLARRQGVKDEELLTPANLDIPIPEGVADEGPGYTDYSVDAPAPDAPTAATVSEPVKALDPAQLESPADWLDSLASGQGFGARPPAETPDASTRLSDDDMKAALAGGKEIAPEEMEAWFNRQLDRGFERDEPELLDEDEPELAFDPEAPAIPAALPDWLSEMAPAPSEPPQIPPAEQQAFLDKIVEPPAVPDMPDWLQEEVSAHSDLDLDNIFVSEAPATPEPAAPVVSQAAPATALEVDHTDPWVEAFDHEQGIITLPDVPGGGPAPAVALEEAVLEPEEELPAGQLEAVPDWLAEAVPAEAAAIELGEMPDWLTAPVEAAAPIASADMPDWLKEVGAEIELAEVPDWLKETSDTEEQVAIPAPQPAPMATIPVVVPSVVPVPVSPAPVPLVVTMSEADAAQVLSSARSRAESNVDASLGDYEKLVRANAQLEAVVSDLSSLVKRYDKNPAVYRVLGDGLMRQGQLQTALDTYRKALNLL